MSKGIRVGISERLLGEVIQKNNELTQENEKLREALSTCDPYTAHTGTCLHVCEFCLNHPHTKDCEYIRLCGEGWE